MHPPTLLAAALILTASVSASAAPDATAPTLEVRFYPSRALRTHELEARRGLATAVLQNAAIVNRGASPIALEKVEFEIVAAGAPIATQHLAVADLDRAAARGTALDAQGILRQLAFQFRPDLLLAGAKLAPGRELPPGGALLLGQRTFAFSGKPDALRLRAIGRHGDGAPVEGVGELSIDGAGSALEYDFPLAGTWYIGAGATPHSHHRWAVPEEFALDILKIGDGGLTHRGDGSRRTDYFAYGAPVRAAADGVVVAAIGDVAETDADFRRPGEALEAYQQRVLENQAHLLAAGIEKAAGNYVLIAHDQGEFSLYAHLQKGSVAVEKGAQVKRGQTIGKLGTSGNSTEPHLHFQLMDAGDPFLAAGIPIRFRGLELPFSDSPRQIQTGDLVIAE